MKKLVLLLFITSLALPLFGDAQFRMALDFSRGITNPTIDYEVVKNALSDFNNVYFGAHTEVIFDVIGLGFSGLIFFKDVTIGENTNPGIAWDGSVFLSYHLFEGGAFIDPFFEMGFGAVGNSMISGSTAPKGTFGPSTWGEKSVFSDNPQYNSSYYNINAEISLYPYVGAGAALDLDGMLIGGKITYHPVELGVPGLNPVNMDNFKVVLFGGFAIGGRE